MSTLLYEILYWLLGMTLVFTHSFRVMGTRRIPQTGPVLLIANHQSYLDVVPLGLAAHRRIFYLAKLPLFRSKILAVIMRFFGTVPVDNVGFSRAGLQGILDCLKENKAALVFPEGERCFDGKMNELKPGVSLVIKKAPVTIVPMGIAGAHDAWPRQRSWPAFAPTFLSWSRKRIAVCVGRPLDGVKLAKMSREEMIQTLHAALVKVVERAERLRGNRQR